MRLLYTAGTARGGTNFRTLILNNHPRIRMSLDPFIPLFRYYRDSLLKHAGAGDLLVKAPSNVLDDYYFNVHKLDICHTIQSTNPDIPFDMSNWETLKSAIASRMKLASVNLIPHLDKLPAPTFKEVFFNTMKVISATREGDLDWVGFNDNWTMEFFPLIAKLIPNAKFMLHLRDPRAVVFSSEFAEPDPAKRPTVISFARHLRKYYAFASFLPTLPELKDRLQVTYYESFIDNPEQEVRRMMDFLKMDYRPEMIEVSSFKKADGSQWSSDWKIYQESKDVWKKDMPREMAELTEFICDPEMQLHGYGPHYFDSAKGLSSSALEYTLKNSRECLGWRTDFPEIELTLGAELFRKQILKNKTSLSETEIQRCFLFKEVYQKVMERY